MGFSSSQLVVFKKCSKSILCKLSSSDEHRRERRRLSVQKEGKCAEMNATPDLAYQCKRGQPQPTQSKHVSTKQHQKLQNVNACAAAVETSTSSSSSSTMQMNKTHSHRLSQLLDPQASQSVPDTHINRSGSLGDLPPLKIVHGQQQRHNKPTSTSTPVTPIQTTFNDANDRFNLTYSKSSASNNSSSSCSEEEEAVTPSTSCTLPQWLTAEDMNYDKDAMATRRSKSQGNRTMMMLMMEAKPSPSFSSPFFPIADHHGSISSASTGIKKANLDRSHSQSSSSSSSLDSKSIFGKSEFRKKESKAIRMWHTTVERLMMQRKTAIALEQQQRQQRGQKPKVK